MSTTVPWGQILILLVRLICEAVGASPLSYGIKTARSIENFLEIIGQSFTGSDPTSTSS